MNEFSCTVRAGSRNPTDLNQTHEHLMEHWSLSEHEAAQTPPRGHCRITCYEVLDALC